MDLDIILDVLRKEIDVDDGAREKVLPHSREAVRKCSQSIKNSHRRNFEEAEKLIKEADALIKEASTGMSKSQFLSKSKILDVAYQELTEAVNLLSLLRDGIFTPPENYQIPSRSYLTGLADTVGELRRAVLDSLRAEQIDVAERLLLFMEEILENLNTFDYPNALVPELRRKCDVGRALVERTRGDVTTSLQSSRLIKELREFDKRLDGNDELE
ncbi:MAG: translin family protein [Candidatus Thorarchaeota archaeon]